MYICVNDQLVLDQHKTLRLLNQRQPPALPLSNQSVFGLRATARYLDFMPETLVVWHSLGKYNDLLQPQKRGRTLIYRLGPINAFLRAHGKANSHLLFDPVYGRKRTANYLRRSVWTIAEYDYTGKVKLDPFLIGRSVRYPLSSLNDYLDSFLRP